MAGGVAELRQFERALAFCIAMAGWAGVVGAIKYLSQNFVAMQSGLSMFALYFTNWASLMTAVVFTGIVLRNVPLSRRSILGHVVVTLAIVFVMYWAFQGLDHFYRSPISQKIVHLLLLPAALLYWVMSSPKSDLEWPAVMHWTFVPILYTVYGLARGYLTGVYPYDQANFEVLGFRFVFGLIAVTAAFALATGSALLFWDKRGAPILSRSIARFRTIK